MLQPSTLFEGDGKKMKSNVEQARPTSTLQGTRYVVRRDIGNNKVSFKPFLVIVDIEVRRNFENLRTVY